MPEVNICDDCRALLHEHIEETNGWHHDKAIIHARCLNDMIGECSCRPPHTTQFTPLVDVTPGATPRPQPEEEA